MTNLISRRGWEKHVGKKQLEMIIDGKNVGRIAERIVSNALEARGFRVTDLNRDGLAANADLLAVGYGKVWQVQVKGATNTLKGRPWVQYGYCTDKIINRKEPMFNRHSSFYKADIVVLVAVRSPNEYCCVVLPIEIAEQAAQKNLDRYFRKLTRKGTPSKPGKVGGYLVPRKPRIDDGLDILEQYKEAWNVLLDNQCGT